MDRNWLLVIIAACFEVGWVTGLKHAGSVLEWGLTVIAIVVSFGLLIYAGKVLPTTTVYAVFVGLGTAGTVIVEMLGFDEPFSWAKAALIVSLVAGIIGLKAVTGHPDTNAERGDRR